MATREVPWLAASGTQAHDGASIPATNRLRGAASVPEIRAMHVVILAAGTGSRLRPLIGALPKALLEVGGRTLIDRSVERLVRHGLASLTVVAGYGAEAFRPVLRALAPDVRIVENDAPDDNGSMRSLALAVEAWGGSCPEEVLVAEGDLLYGADALRALSEAPPSDATVLCSTPTGAGDEVWVRGEAGRVTAIAKGSAAAPPVLGELVGLTRIRREALHAMVASHREGGEGAAREHYEERLAAVAGSREVRALVVPGLVWAEIDDAGHLARAEREVLPRLEADDAAAAAG